MERKRISTVIDNLKFIADDQVHVTEKAVIGQRE